MSSVNGAPQVEEVRPGIWALPLPMPGPLEHVFAYAVERDGGLLLINAGPDDDRAFAALHDGLASAGAGFDDVRGVLFTHAHPDHHGAAGRLREVTGAWHAMHAAEAELVARVTEEGRAEGLVELEAWLEELGAGSAEIVGILDMVRGFAIRRRESPAERMIAEGDSFEVSGGRLITLHTPGHAPGHLCFVHHDAALVFTGDHVLSPTTPNVSVNRFTRGNPLADYLDALGRMTALGDMLGLPGHQDRMPVARRASEIIAHHEEQLASVQEILAAGPQTVRDVAGAMSWAFPWERFGPGSMFMAMGEALAHLVMLERRGLAERVPEAPGRWRLSDRGRSAPASP